MPTETTSKGALLMIMSDFGGGRALYDGAQARRVEHGHIELDPIHFVEAAMVDPRVPVATKKYLEHFGIFANAEALENGMNAIRVATRTVKVGSNGDTVELFNIDTARLMRSLAMRFSLYIDTRTATLATEPDVDSTWSWYEQTIKAALELQDTPSIEALHAHSI